MSSSVDKTKETKNLEGVEALSSTPDKIKEKIIANSIKEEDKTSQDMIKIMRKKITQNENSVTIEAHEWEALCKMFQVLQIQSKDSDLDDDTLNIIQNMCNTLQINLTFTEDGSCVPIDFSDYEGEDVEVNIKPSTEIELSDELIGNLMVTMDDYDREISASVKRINPSLHSKLEKITAEKLDTINKIDNCISLLVSIQYFDIKISEEMRVNLKDIIDELNDFVRKHTKETKKFYRKFNDIDNKEEYTMAVVKRGSQREFKSVKRATRAATEAIKKDRKAKRKGETIERKRYPGANEREDRGKTTHEKNMEKLERLKEKIGKPANPYKKKGKNRDDDDDKSSRRNKRDREDREERSSRRNKKDNDKEMDMEKTLKKVRKEYKDDLKEFKLLEDLDDLISDGDRVKNKDIEKFLKLVKAEDAKVQKGIAKMLKDILEDDDDDKSSRRNKRDKGKRSRRDRDDDDRSSRRNKKDKGRRSRRDRDDDDDKSSRRNKRDKGRNKKKRGGDEMIDYLDIDVKDVSDILNDIVDEHSKEIKKYSKDLFNDLSDVAENIEDDEDLVPKALGMLFVIGMNMKVKKSILKQINSVFKNNDEDEDEDDDDRSSRRNKRDKGRNKKSRKDDDMEDIKEVLEDILDEHKRVLKKEDLVEVIEDLIDDIEDDEAKLRDVSKVHKKLAKLRDLKKEKLIKKLSKLVDSEDEDEDDDRSSRRNKRDKGKRSRRDRDKKSDKFKVVGELLEDIKEDFEDELEDADLLDTVEDLIESIEDRDAKEKDIVKLVKKLKKEEDLEDAKKLIKKIEKEVSSDDDDEDDDDRSSRRNKRDKGRRSRRDKDDDDDRSSRRNKRDKGRNKKNKIDFDDIEPRKKDIREIEDLVSDSDLDKADKKKANKYIDKEDWEALYDLAKDEDSDLADDLKEIFRGLAREVDSDDFDSVKGYFKDFTFIDKEDLDDVEFKVVMNTRDLEKLNLDSNDAKFKIDMSELIGMSMGDIIDIDKPKFNKDIKTIIIFTDKTMSRGSSRNNLLTEEDTEE